MSASLFTHLLGALTFGRNTSRSKELMQASLFTHLLGALDEWLSQRSAKPSTAVRIRQAPRKFFEKSGENIWWLAKKCVPLHSLRKKGTAP